MATIVQIIPLCVQLAAQLHGVPEPDLWTLLHREGGTLGLEHRNPNKTVDYGPWQINSSWVPALRRAWRQPDDQSTIDALKWNGCWSAAAAAAIYRLALVHARGDQTAAVRIWNTGRTDTAAGARYAELFSQSFSQLYPTTRRSE
jgi:hypothetical protein